MKILFLILTFILCASCAKPPALPTSDIHFISIGAVGGSPLFEVRFSSKTDMLRFFKVNTGEDQLGETLICSLDKGADFAKRQDLARYVQGEITEIDNVDPGVGHLYSASVFAMQTKDGGVSSTFISTDELLAMLKERDSVPCKVFTSAYSYGPYYSNLMNIPGSDFIRVIEQVRGL